MAPHFLRMRPQDVPAHMAGKIHGYHLTDAEARDIAAQVVMVIEAERIADVVESREWRPADGGQS